MNAKMHNPPHPGRVVKRSLIDNTDLSVTSAAKLLGVGRVTLSKLINGKAGISPEMAVRLSIVLDTSSEMWLNMQTMYDLAQAEKKRKKLKLMPLDLFIDSLAS
ncbi:MAG: transcriptional regulator [marine bacterium B5-7]|nr:MAG: transcriptional regulator [marine bacterium B5-7]